MNTENNKTEELNELLSEFYQETERDEFLGNLGFAKKAFNNCPVAGTDFDVANNIKLRIVHHNNIVRRWQYTAVSIAACLAIVISLAFYTNIIGINSSSHYQPLLAWDNENSDVASISQGVEEIAAQINTNITNNANEEIANSLINLANEIENFREFWI